MQRPGAALLKLFGSSIIDQAMISAANFLVGLVLIRYTHDAQYGYYVLAFNAMMLATTLQGTFIGTPFVIRLPSLSEQERRDWVGSLLRDQFRWGALGSVVTLAGVWIAWYLGELDHNTVPVFMAGTVLILCQLYREYFRSILLMVQRTMQVLVADAAYIVCLMLGAVLATRFAHAAMVALFTGAVSALIGAAQLRHQLGPEGMNRHAAPGTLALIARTGAWAAAGGVIYWAFTQGYSFVAAATLNIAGVAALAASRLLLMPINLLSAGVQKQLVPIASNWLHDYGMRRTFRHILMFSALLAGATVVYGVVIWLLRDWIFDDIMRKTFAYRNTLLLGWIAIFLVMVIRDPLTQLMVLRQRFRVLMFISLACAAVALTTSYVGMLYLDTRGALVGILVGELLNVAAVLWLIRDEIRRDTDPVPVPQASC